MKNKVGRIALALATSAALLTCGGPTEPRGAVLNVTLATTNTGDGAILLSLTGPVVDSVTASTGLEGFVSAGSSGKRVLLIGDIRPGVILSFRIPDRDAASQYRASVLQVAKSDDLSQRSRLAYSVSVEAQ